MEFEKIAYTVKEAMQCMGLCRESFYVEVRSGRLETFLIPKRKRRVSAWAIKKWAAAREAAMPKTSSRKAG